VLLVDKPAGLTSHDVVARVRRILRTREVGHTGTLDPFATGLLILLIGRATRLARFIEGDRKQYLATARLGMATTTDDVTGEVVDRRSGGWAVGRFGGQAIGGLGDSAIGGPDRTQVEAALASFVGPQRQRPPVFSAKHVDGERSYAKARRGEAVELAEVDVVVHAVELVGYDYPELRFRVTVSAGTYVRALARDLGERLHIGAHLTALRREAIGGLGVASAVALEALGPETKLLPPLDVLGHLDRLDITEEQARDLGFGRQLRLAHGQLSIAGTAASSEWTAAVAPGERLIAIGRVEGGEFRPQVVLEAAAN
jgi:tRNA pseudouridine55 synthase